MSENPQIVAGGPWSRFDGRPNKPSLFRLRDAVWILAAVVVLLVVGIGLLCVAIWAFTGTRWSPE